MSTAILQKMLAAGGYQGFSWKQGWVLLAAESFS
jgi:hypothetical protein